MERTRLHAPMGLVATGGKVGVGTTNPVDALQVNGNITVGVGTDASQSLFVRAPGHKNSLAISGDWSDGEDKSGNAGQSYRWSAIGLRAKGFYYHPGSIDFFSGGYVDPTMVLSDSGNLESPSGIRKPLGFSRQG
jgi:hypothetical protein